MQQSLDYRTMEARKALAHIISVDAGTNSDFLTLMEHCTIAAVEGTKSDIALLEEVRTSLSNLAEYLLARMGDTDPRAMKVRMALAVCDTALEYHRNTKRHEYEDGERVAVWNAEKAEYRLLDTLARKGNMPIDELAEELAVTEPVTEKLIKPHMDAEFVKINFEGWYMITPLGRRRRSELKQKLKSE
jgi:hypothetical protein